MYIVKFYLINFRNALKIINIIFFYCYPFYKNIINIKIEVILLNYIIFIIKYNNFFMLLFFEYCENIFSHFLILYLLESKKN
jgi:hypothetical protein